MPQYVSSGTCLCDPGSRLYVTHAINVLAVRAVRAGSASLRDETMKQSFLEVDGGQCQRNTDQCLKVAVLLRQEQRQEQAKEGWLGTADGRGLISLHFLPTG